MKPSVLLALGVFCVIAVAVALLTTANAQEDRPIVDTVRIEVVFPTELPPLVVTFPTQIPPMPMILEPTLTPTPIATPTPGIVGTLTPTPRPTISPTRTLTQEGFEGYLNYGEQYLLPDGLKASVESVEITKVGNVTTVNFVTSIENTSPDLMRGGRFALYYEGAADEEKLKEMRFDKGIIWYAKNDGSQGITYHPKGWAKFEEGYRLPLYEDVPPLQTWRRYSTINIQSLDPNGKLFLAYPTPYGVQRHHENHDFEAGELPPDELVWRLK